MTHWRGRAVGGRITNLLFITILGEIGSAITLATGFLPIAGGPYLVGSLGSRIVSSPCRDLSYGLPFPWRTVWFCRVQLDVSAFLFDTLAYMALGYVLVVGIERRRRGSVIDASPLFLLATIFSVSALLLSMSWNFTALASVQVYDFLWFVLSFSAVLISGLVLFILGPGPVRPHLSSLGLTLVRFRKFLLVYGLVLFYLVVANVLYSFNQILLPFGNLVYWFVLTLNIAGAIGALCFSYLNRKVRS